MIEKLNELCGDLKLLTKDSKRKLFLIEDRIENQSQFLTSYLLDYSLRNGDGVIFVSSVQNYAMYFSISKRLGLNIEPQINSGNLTYIDCFTGASDWIADEIPYTEEASNLWNPLPPKATRIEFREGKEDAAIKEIFEAIETELIKKKGRPVIIFDNVTNLLNFGVSEMALLTLTTMIHNLIETSEKQPTVFIGFTPEIVSEKQAKVCTLLKMNYDALFEIYPNPSGFSKEVSGQFKVTTANDKSFKTQTLKYKLELNKVNIFEYLNQ